jgi:dihydroorotate dehydrogenase
VTSPYRLLFDHVLTRTDPERAHHAAFRAIRAAEPLTRRLFTREDANPSSVHALRRRPVASSPVRAMGLTFQNVLGLAAGFDKNAVGIDALAALGFGHVEIGTVTGEAQPGNPKPRLFRLPEDRAVVNRMGFNNDGAEVVARRLAAREQATGRRRGASTSDGSAVLGVNIGKTKVVPDDDEAAVLADYGKSARLLSPYADYLVVNVSSPNTPGLRNLQAVESLRPILAAVREETTTPVLVKIAPDLSDSDIDEIADLAVELGLAGIVATNTTVSRAGLATPGAAELGPGGISGPPLARRSAEVLRRLYTRVGGRLVLISVGGIETPDDAWERITAGASLLQGYTGFIYGGGLWVKHIHDGIARRLHAGGFSSLSEAVGSAAR